MNSSKELKGSQEKSLSELSIFSSLQWLSFLVFGIIFVFIIFFRFCDSNELGEADSSPTINYIWLGERRIHNVQWQSKFRLQSVIYPKLLLGDYEWNKFAVDFHKYDLPIIHKTHILALLYLYQNGGVYFDIDTFIDYSCLQQLLAPKNGFIVAGEPVRQLSHSSSSGWFMYASNKKNQKIKTILSAIKQKLQSVAPEDWQSQNRKTIDMISGSTLYMEKGAQKMDEIYKCANHIKKGVWKKNIDNL